jgi:hypothetical protein
LKQDVYTRVYYWEGALTMQGPITFDAEVIHIHIKTEPRLSESTVNVQLLNGARASNIYCRRRYHYT